MGLANGMGGRPRKFELGSGRLQEFQAECGINAIGFGEL